ncbi:MAG: hypothetical protein ABIU77_21410 [Ferruginibacter sp.]
MLLTFSQDKCVFKVYSGRQELKLDIERGAGTVAENPVTQSLKSCLDINVTHGSKVIVGCSCWRRQQIELNR